MSEKRGSNELPPYYSNAKDLHNLLKCVDFYQSTVNEDIIIIGNNWSPVNIMDSETDEWRKNP